MNNLISLMKQINKDLMLFLTNWAFFDQTEDGFWND